MDVTKWLNPSRFRKSRLSRTGSNSRKQRKRAVSPSQIEALEDRILLSATANDDAASTVSGVPANIHVLGNDSGDEGPLTIISVSSPSNGRAIVDDFEVSGGTTTSTGSSPSGGTSYTPPQSGLVTGIRYAPRSDFVGTDTFTYTMQDGLGNQATATVTVTVDANGTPTLVADDVSTPPNTPVLVDVISNDSDPDGDAISLETITQPEHGTAEIRPIVAQSIWDQWVNTGQNYFSTFEQWYSQYYGDPSTLDYGVYYAPPTGFAGIDALQYTVSDEHGAKSSATLSVTVTENQPPVTQNDAVAIAQGDSAEIDVLSNDSDPEGGELTIVNVSQPDVGTVTIQPGGVSQVFNPTNSTTQTIQLPPTLLFEPPKSFSGSETFNYTVADELGAEQSASVTVFVAPDQKPDAVADAVQTLEQTPVSIDVLQNDSDPENTELSIASFTQPVQGQVTLQPGGTSYVFNPTNSTSTTVTLPPKLLYTPPVGFSGTATFQYTIQDGFGLQDTASVTVTVAANQSPTAVDDSASTSPDVAVDISVTVNDTDPEGHELHIDSFTQPNEGLVTLVPTVTSSSNPAPPQLRYTPPVGFTGVETFSYVLEDELGAQDVATVTVTVGTPSGSPPAFQQSTYSFSVAADAGFGAVVGTVTAIDPDSDPVNYTGVDTWPFAVDSSTGEVTVDVTADLTIGNSYTFDVVADDGSGFGSDTTTVTITVGAPNNLDPTFDSSDYTFYITPDITWGSYVGTVSASDPDTDPVTYWVDWSWPFEVESTTGNIYIYSTDFLAIGQTYTFDVWTSDAEGSDAVSVTVEVVDSATSSQSVTLSGGGGPPTRDWTVSTSSIMSSDPSISGSSNVDEAGVFTLQLNSNGSTVTEWNIDWGDGNVQSYAGGETEATHVYPDGDENYTIDVTVLYTDGTSGQLEGRTPGYWKQPHHYDEWNQYVADDDYETIFGVTAPEKPPTLLDALNANKNDASNGAHAALWRHSVAALLNAAHPNVNYRYSIQEIQQIVQDAYSTGDYAAARDLLEVENELGGGINEGGGVTEYSLQLSHAIAVDNVAPTLILSGDSEVGLLETYTMGLSSADPGLDTITHWTINWGDGNIETVSGNPSSTTHVYDDIGTFQITATATDEDGTFASNSLTVEVVGLRLVEQTNFVTEYTNTFTVPQNPSGVAFRFFDLDYDLTDPDSINDAFEISIVDSDGNPLVATVAQGRDVYFNATEGEAIQLGGGTTYASASGIVTVDISHLAAGMTATLVARLVNNDEDTTTAVTVVPKVDFVTSTANSTLSVPFGYVSRPGPVDFSHLGDVTPSIGVDYLRTSYDEHSGLLMAGMDATNVGTFPLSGPLLVAVKNITAPTVTASGYDGITPDGLPYYDLSHLAFATTDDTFEPGATASGFDLTFRNPHGVQFDYELVFLAHINEAPQFTTTPVTEVLAGRDYYYDSGAQDPENDELAYSLVWGPDGLAVNAETGELGWSTAAGDVGWHEVIIRTTDPGGLSDDQLYLINVTDVDHNRPPTFTTAPIVDAYVNTPYQYPSAAADPDGDVLTYAVMDGPEGMIINSDTGLVQWQPSADQVGTFVTVTLWVDDSATRGNVAPFAVDDAVATLMNQPVTIDLIGNDVDPEGDPLEVTAVTQPPDGQVTLNDGTAVFTPAAGFAATTTFSYTLQDLYGDQVQGTVTVTVVDPDAAAFNTAPVALDDAALTGIDTQISIAPLTNDFDADGDPLTIDSITQPADGTAVINGNQIVFTPETGFTGDTSLTYDVVDESNLSSTATVTIRVADIADVAGNQPPIAVDDSTSTPIGQTVDIYVADNDFDPEGDQLRVYGLYTTYTNVHLTPFGSFIYTYYSYSNSTTSYRIPILRYTPANGFRGVDTFDYQIDDGSGQPSMATITVTVGDGDAPTNRIPVAVDDAALVEQDQSATIDVLGNDLELDGEALSLIAVGTAANGSASMVDGKIVYQPNSGFTGTDSFTYVVEDVAGHQATGTMNVEVSAFNRSHLSSEQPYLVYVHPEPGNAPPVIISEPSLTHTVPGDVGQSTGLVTPDAIDLELAPGETVVHTVEYERGAPPGAEAIPEAPDDQLTVFPERFNQELQDALLYGNTGIAVTNFTVNRQLHGSGAMSTGVFVNKNGTYGLGEYGVVISSGDVADYGTGPNTTDANATTYNHSADATQEALLDPITGGSYDHYDVTEIIIDFDLLPGFDIVGFNVVFGSEEFEEWQETSFIDAFGLYVNDQNIASVNNEPINIDHPDMRFDDESPLFSGTELDGVLAPNGNPVLTFSEVLGDGATGNTLHLIVADSGDEDYDTTVFIENLVALSSAPIDVDVQPSEAGKPVVNQTGIVQGLELGETATFDVEFTGDGQADAYLLEVFDVNAGTLLGTIPVTVNDDYFYLVEAIDPDNDPLTYTLVSAPAGANMDPDTALISWDPPDPGTYDFHIHVEDGRGGFDEQLFEVTVTDSEAGNTAPTIEPIANRTGQAGRPLEVQVSAEDADGDALRYYLTDAPAGMTIDRETGLIEWSPGLADAGTTPNVSVKVTDRRGGEATTSFTVDVAEQDIFYNSNPEITSDPVTGAVAEQLYRYQVEATDADSDDLTFSLGLAPDGAGIDPETGLIVWRPAFDQLGRFAFSVQVRDTQGGVDSQFFTVDVVSTNDPPEITATPIPGANLSQAWSYQVVATDPNGDTLQYTLTDGPSWMSIDANGLLSGTPTATGDYRVEVTVDDQRGGFAFLTFTLPVRNNAAPTMSPFVIDPAFVDQLWELEIEASDPDNDPLVYTLDAVSQSRGIQLIDDPARPGQKKLQWTPNQLGEFEISVTVDDQISGSVTQTFTLPVIAPVVSSEPPKITSVPTGPAYVGVPWEYLVTATDPDDDDSTIVITVPQESLSHVDFDETTNTLTWTPLASEDPDGLTFVVRATDPAGSYFEQTFTIPVETVEPPGEPPIITSVPTGPAILNQTYRYQVEAYDPDGDALTYSLVNPVANASIDPDTGELTWSPGSTPTTQTFDIKVDDNDDGYATQQFTIDAVAPPPPSSDIPPEFITEPSGVVFVGQPWTYDFAATDVEDDDSTLTYTLEAPSPEPTEVDFDPVNRRLTWTPTDTTPLEFTIRATDSVTNYVEQTFTLTPVNETPPANDPPVIRSIAPDAVRLDDLYTYPVDAYDPNGDPLSYALDDASKQLGANIDEKGVLTWQPSRTGSFTLTVLVSDGVNPDVPHSFNVSVLAPENTNTAPEITSTPTGPAVRNVEWTYQAEAKDPEGDTITWSLDTSAIPSEIDTTTLTIDQTTGKVTWTPLKEGTFQITVIASDGDKQDPQTFFLPVLENANPIITSDPVLTVDLGSPYVYDVDATDPNPEDVGNLTYSLDQGSLDRGLTITADTGIINWTSPGPVNTYPVLVTVTDPDGGQDFQLYDLRVTDPNAANTPPVINSNIRSEIQVGTRLLHQVDATDADGDPLAYSLVTPPAGMTIDSKGLIDWTPTADQAGTMFNFSVRVDDGRTNGQVDKAFSITAITEPAGNAGPTFDNAPGTNLVANLKFTYDAEATDPDGDTIKFTLVEGPVGMTLDETTGLVEWTPRLEQVGDHPFKLRVTDIYGKGEDMSVTLTVRSVNRPPQITADPPSFAIVDQEYTYDFDATDPDGHALTYSLGSQTDASGDIEINDVSGVLTWTPDTLGLQYIQIKIVDEYGMGIVYAGYVDVVATPPNKPPTIDNDPPLLAEEGDEYKYTPDGNDPDNGPQALSYTLVKPAPTLSGMTFNSMTGEIVWLPAAGTQNTQVEFQLELTDGADKYVKWFTVAVTPPNDTPQITAIPDQTISAGALLAVDVKATDNIGDPLKYSIDSASEALGITIDSLGRIRWQTDSNDITSTPHTVTVTVNDGRVDAVETFDVSVVADTTGPTVTIVPSDTETYIGDQITLLVHAVDDVGVESRTLTLESIDDGTTVTTVNEALTLDDQGRAKLTLLDIHLGTLTFVATATDVNGNTTSATPVTVQVFDPNDNLPPTAVITSPGQDQIITEPVPIYGSVYDKDENGVLQATAWELTATPVSGGEIIKLAEGNGIIQDGLLGRFDPTLLRNGLYRLELIATDAGPNETIDSVLVQVEGALKLGNFTMTFVDLEIASSGIPITISRTYDTLRSDLDSDFGYGWSLDLSNTKVSVETVDGTDPGVFGYTPFVDGTRVEIELPDGTTEGFTFYGQPSYVQYTTIIEYYVPTFVPDYGVTSKLFVADAQLKKEPSTGEYYDYNTGHTYSPEDPAFSEPGTIPTYTLSLRNGTLLVINAETGELSQIVDPNDNTLTFTGMGIEHSGGRSVQFERDQNGHITAIIDPNGYKIKYDYDYSTGDLIAVTDRTGEATTKFTYLDGPNDPEHYVDEVIDPFGRTAAKSEYDDDGRLIRQVDADGNVIEFEWNGDSKIQHITNQLGHTTIIETDARGNVIREVDPEGRTMLRTYDDDDNQLTETLVIGEIDSLENGETNDLTTTYRYNEDGDRIETIDPRGVSTRTDYNDFGQPSSNTDALGNTTFKNFDSTTGLLNSIRDPLDNVSSFGYDDKGNMANVRDDNGNMLVADTHNSYGDVTSSTPAVGETTFFDYDLNGNQIASWTFDGEGAARVQLLNLTKYDEVERVVGTKYLELPDGQHVTENLGPVFDDSDYDPYVQWSTSKSYNLAGQVVSSTDRLGNVTTNTYDVRGQSVETRNQTTDEAGNPVELVSRTVYDAAGQVTASTTTYVDGTSEPVEGTLTTYDKAGRVTKTERVTGLEIALVGSGVLLESVLNDPGTVISSSGTEYDTSGRVTASIDTYGLRTETTYNAFGEVVETRRQAYDETGTLVELVSRTVYDQFGRVEFSTDTYQVDSNDEPVDTVYGTQTMYDDLGRASKTIRREGIDIDLTAGETSLAASGTELYSTQSVYDGEGRLIQSIGADGSTTSYEYDSLGRQTAVIGHPLTLDEVGLSNHPLATASNPADKVSLRSETVYDDQGRVLTERRNIRHFYLADGKVQTDESAVQETTHEYDENGNATKTTFAPGTPDETFVEMAYDDFGRKISETNQMGLTRTFTYDEDGRLASVTLPPAEAGGTAPVYTYDYDEWGNQTLLVDPNGHETRFAYDDEGRQLARTLPLGYGADGIEGTADDPPNPDDWTETFEYDERGRRTLHVSFEGVVTQFVYDDTTDGRLAEKRFFDNLTQYDNGNGTPTETVSNVYDAFGRMVSTTQSDTARIESNTYDAQGRLTQVATPEGILVYDYDDLGRKTATKVFDAAADPGVDDPERVTSYTYDALGRLKTVTEDADVNQTGEELDTAYYYDLVGNLDLTLLPNDIAEDYVYDNLNRLDLMAHYTTNGTEADLKDLTNNDQVALFDYTVRNDGKRTGLSETFYDNTGAVLVSNDYTWNYDDLGRLVQEIIDSSDSARKVTVDYTYDAVGNRLSKAVDNLSDGSTDETVTYDYDANDRLLTEEKDTDGVAGAEETTTYSYDKTQQTGKVETKSDGSTVTTTNTFDLQGRMATVTIEKKDNAGTLLSKTVNTYDYDSSGIRIAVLTEIDSDGDGTFETRTRIEHLVDKRNFTGYAQTIRETEYDADTGNVVKVTDYTFGHDEISQTVTEYDEFGNPGTPVTHVFGHDGHGSVRVLFDAMAAAVQLFVYDAYGIMHAIYDGAGTFVSADASAALTNLLYSGEKTDAMTSLQYLRARYYDPNMGRFNRLDPFLGNLSDPQSFHKYLYAHADPVNLVDPSGMISAAGLGVSMGIGALVGGLGTAALFHGAGRSPTYGAIVGALGGASLVYSYFRGILPRVLGEAFLASTIVVVSELARDYWVAPQGQNAGQPITYIAEAVEAFGWGAFIGAFAIVDNWDSDPTSGDNLTALAMAQSEVITVLNITASVGAMAWTAATAILALVGGVDAEKVKQQVKTSLSDELAVAMNAIVGAYLPLIDSIAGEWGQKIIGFRVLSTRQRALVIENLFDISLAAQRNGGGFSIRQYISTRANRMATELVDAVFDLIEA